MSGKPTFPGMVLLGLLACVPASAAALVISGNILETTATLEAPLVFDHMDGRVPEPGPYTFQFLDSAGAVLRSVPFRTDLIYACGNGPCRAITTTFNTFLPLTADLVSHMAALRILHGERTLAETRSTAHRPSTTREAQTVAPIPPGREPRAVAAGKGQVRLTWDATVHPRVMVRNAAGTVIGFLKGGSGTLSGVEGPHLDLLMSDGLRCLTCRVDVAPLAEGPAALGELPAEDGKAGV